MLEVQVHFFIFLLFIFALAGILVLFFNVTPEWRERSKRARKRRLRVRYHPLVAATKQPVKHQAEPGFAVALPPVEVSLDHKPFD